MPDHIRLLNMTFYGYHGVRDDERQFGQPISIDVDLTVDLAPAGETDDLEAGLDYSQVYGVVKGVQESGPFKLLETLAEQIARQLLLQFLKVREVTVRARKREPAVGGLVEYAEVEITRGRLNKEDMYDTAYDA